MCSYSDQLREALQLEHGVDMKGTLPRSRVHQPTVQLAARFASTGGSLRRRNPIGI